jgi:O-antigen ligase
MNSISLLCFGLLGVYELNNSEGISLFSRNPLPAGASLALLSAGPMILLAQKNSAVSRIVLAPSLILAVSIIVLLAKKGPILNLIVIFLFWVIVNNLRYLKSFMVLVLLVGSLFYFSGPTLSKYKSFAELNTSESNYVQSSTLSLMLRVEYYFFGFHIFKESPIWGIGSRADFNPYFDNYKIKLPENLMSKAYFYNAAIRDKTFENIFLSFLIEMGGLFTITYFGGLLYIMARCLKSSPSPTKEIEVISLVSVMVGFLVISCTFDTLRFPNLNWLFHSLLGLMVNLPRSSIKETPEPS